MRIHGCLNLTALQYAIEHGCPWGEKTRAAAKHQCATYLDILCNQQKENEEIPEYIESLFE